MSDQYEHEFEEHLADVCGGLERDCWRCAEERGGHYRNIFETDKELGEEAAGMPGMKAPMFAEAVSMLLDAVFEQQRGILTDGSAAFPCGQQLGPFTDWIVTLDVFHFGRTIRLASNLLQLTEMTDDPEAEGVDQAVAVCVAYERHLRRLYDNYGEGRLNRHLFPDARSPFIN